MKTLVISFFILLVVLVIFSFTGLEVYNEDNQKKNNTDDGEATFTTSVQEYDVM